MKSVSSYLLSKNIEYHNLNIGLSKKCNQFSPLKKFACYDNSGVSKFNCDSRSELIHLENLRNKLCY